MDALEDGFSGTVLHGGSCPSPKVQEFPTWSQQLYSLIPWQWPGLTWNLTSPMKLTWTNTGVGGSTLFHYSIYSKYTIITDNLNISCVYACMFHLINLLLPPLAHGAWWIHHDILSFEWSSSLLWCLNAGTWMNWVFFSSHKPLFNSNLEFWFWTSCMNRNLIQNFPTPEAFSLATYGRQREGTKDVHEYSSNLCSSLSETNLSFLRLLIAGITLLWVIKAIVLIGHAVLMCGICFLIWTWTFLLHWSSQ